MNNQDTHISVLCATDNNYAPYCGIMLTSLFESNKDCRFQVFVFVDGVVSESNSRKFRGLGEKYNSEVNLVNIDNRMLEDFPVNSQRDVDNHVWVTLPTYYRLLAARLLPPTVHRVLYLDCDVAVVGDIKPFWNLDLSGKAIAGITDCDGQGNGSRLGLPPECVYINAGVALYNLDYWRENHVEDAFFGYIRDNGSRLLLMDQDVVNGVLHDKMSVVSERYNMQVAFFSPMFWNQYSETERERILDENKAAVVIHYCGGIKPWDFRYYGCPYYAEWERFRKMSLWRKSHVTRPKGMYFKFLLRKHLFSRKLKQKRQSAWVVIPENRACF